MKHWRDLPDFAPDNATRVRDNEAITDLRAWCIREPDSKPQYTVVRLTTGNDSGITALWKVGALADVAGIRMAPHACEGPIGGIASIHVDAAMPNFLVRKSVARCSPASAIKFGRTCSDSRPCVWSTGAILCPTNPDSGLNSTRQH